jgi:hypothetical protein
MESVFSDLIPGDLDQFIPIGAEKEVLPRYLVIRLLVAEHPYPIAIKYPLHG